MDSIPVNLVYQLKISFYQGLSHTQLSGLRREVSERRNNSASITKNHFLENSNHRAIRDKRVHHTSTLKSEPPDINVKRRESTTITRDPIDFRLQSPGPEFTPHYTMIMCRYLEQPHAAA